jgi:putative DNA primase/helicase
MNFEELPVEDDVSPPTVTTPAAKGKGKRKRNGAGTNGEKPRADKAAAEAAAWKAVDRAAAAGTRQDEFLLLVTDREGGVHEWPAPAGMLVNDGVAFREALAGLGLRLEHARGARDDLTAYALAWRTTDLVLGVAETGWHGDLFVLPRETYGDTKGERVVFRAAHPPVYALEGSLEGWRDELARYAVGNSRLALGIMTQFAGPLLPLLDEDGGGFHLGGGSSIGKTSVLLCGASVWGLTMGSWRTTDNALEGTARAANHTGLCLDETSQADPRTVGEAVYMLANGQGKGRMGRDGASRETTRWRLLFLSSGEEGLASRLEETGKRAKAGQQVRLVEFRADPGEDLGVFETLHGFASGGALSDHLRIAAERHKGHAGRAFAAALAEDRALAVAAARAARDAWLLKHLPQGVDGQVRRVAGRFALVAAAGELATRLGILPWPEGEAGRAATVCFTSWLATRGGTGPSEVREGVAQVRGCLDRHGSSRFENAWAKEGGEKEEPEPDRHARTFDRLGFRRLVEERWWYFVLPEMWRREVCKGRDAEAVARAMADAGHLEKGEGDHLALKVRVPGVGPMRLYAIKPGFLGVEDGP